MKNMLRNLGPAAVVVATAICLYWPYENRSAALLDDLEGPKLPRIDKRQLAPTISAPSARNPFRPVTRTLVVASDETQEPLDQPQPTQSPQPPPIDPREIVASLELRGTLVNGKRNSALIGEKLFFEGELVPTSVHPEVPCRLVRVASNAVWLEADGQELRLDYTRSPTPHGSEQGEAERPAENPGVESSEPSAGSAEQASGVVQLVRQLRALLQARATGAADGDSRSLPLADEESLLDPLDISH